MTAVPPGGHADPPARREDWLVLTASERGASHIAARSPNQDAVATERAGANGVVAAVADGHGHPRHLRSARGSRLGVKIGCQVAQELAELIDENSAYFSQREPNGAAGGQAREIAELAEEFLAPEIVRRWREAVLADVKADPFTAAEQEQRHLGDDPVIAYGSTLLLGIALLDWLVLAQIGDGDIVGVRGDGGCVLPVPDDPQLDGLVTTSLCGTDPLSDFRIAVLDTAREPLAALLLATDGYGNAQMAQDWPGAFSKDLAWMLAERDLQWLAAQLPAWAARCASSDGSADDTTVAMLVASSATVLRTDPPDEGSEETTVPAVPHAETVPVHLRAEPHSIEPVTMRQLAHRAAPEPMMLERTTERSAPHGPETTELVSREPETTELLPPRREATELVSREPETTELFPPAPETTRLIGDEPATNQIPTLRDGDGAAGGSGGSSPRANTDDSGDR